METSDEEEIEVVPTQFRKMVELAVGAAYQYAAVISCSANSYEPTGVEVRIKKKEKATA